MNQKLPVRQHGGREAPKRECSLSLSDQQPRSRMRVSATPHRSYLGTSCPTLLGTWRAQWVSGEAGVVGGEGAGAPSQAWGVKTERMLVLKKRRQWWFLKRSNGLSCRSWAEFVIVSALEFKAGIIWRHFPLPHSVSVCVHEYVFIFRGFLYKKFGVFWGSFHWLIRLIPSGKPLRCDYLLFTHMHYLLCVWNCSKHCKNITLFYLF